MAVTYYALLTTIGAGKLANATALGTTLKITQLAVGDGGGNVPTPDASRTQLVNEVRRAPLNRLSVDPANSSQIIAEQVIPEDVGGWWIREMGLYDEAGALIAYANCAPSYKPQLAEGSGRTQTVRIVLIVSNAASVELKIDPSVVLATREYVDSAIVSAMNRLDCKQSVRVATTASITLSGLQTLDGIVLGAGDRVLVKNQSNAADNGIYVAATNAWKRSTDADENSEVTPGLTVVVESGTSQADSIWQLVTDGAIVLGTTALTFQNITNGLARLASPAFTGNPTAPTQDVSDNDTSLATTAFVRNAMAAYGIATSALSPQVTDFDDVALASGLYFVPATATGGPLASQGGLIHRIYGAGGFQIFMMYSSDRAWIRRRGTSTWGPWREVAFLDSPTFTGTPAAPTPPRGDGTTKLATTAYVQDALSSAGLASATAGETPVDSAALAAMKSGMYYLPSTVSPYPSTNAFVMRMTYVGNRGFELMNAPYTDRFWARASNNDGTWRAPVELAKLDSPALSGAPSAPTPPMGSNTQQIATTAFVQTTIKGRQQRFAVSGSFMVPAGVSTVYLTGCGAGGGGGGGGGFVASGSGGGGGGGAGQSMIREAVTVTPGQVYIVTIGAGGSAGGGGSVGANGQNGGAGGATSFGALVTLVGGGSATGGGGTSGSGGPGGAGGNFGGSSGEDGKGNGGDGGAGGPSPLGTPGGGGRAGSSGGMSGSLGYGYGAGGGGGGAAYNAGLGAAGTGGMPGLLIVEW